MQLKSRTIYLLPSLLSEDSDAFFTTAYFQSFYATINTYICENEKVARHFFKKIGTPIPQEELNLIQLPKHNDNYSGIRNFLTDNLQNSIGLLSDAGLPCIADPGNKVVQLAHKLDIKVVPVAGPCSMTMALMASGFNGQNFAFNGYLPIKELEKKKAILLLQDRLIKENQTQIFIETPYRNQALFESFLKYLKPNVNLSISANLMGQTEFTISKSIIDWKNENFVIEKIPCVFVIGNR